MIIYKATNIKNGKVYIGQTINTLEYRKQQHFREAKSKRRNTVYFHNALLKYGFDNFEFQEIDYATTIDELNEKERYWIQYYNSNDKSYGYNLDSGGTSGGTKSESTKRKIGETSKAKWNNPEIASKMLAGLQKGANTMKKNVKRFPFVCPICGQTFYYPKHIAENKKYCSQKCASLSTNYMKGVLRSAEVNHQRNIERKQNIKKCIIDWIMTNKNIILNCPFNKITPTLSSLSEILYQQFNIKDIRSIFICFDVKNKKELLTKFKEIILFEENIC